MEPDEGVDGFEVSLSLRLASADPTERLVEWHFAVTDEGLQGRSRLAAGRLFRIDSDEPAEVLFIGLCDNALYEELHAADVEDRLVGSQGRIWMALIELLDVPDSLSQVAKVLDATVRFALGASEARLLTVTTA